MASSLKAYHHLECCALTLLFQLSLSNDCGEHAYCRVECYSQGELNFLRYLIVEEEKVLKGVLLVTTYRCDSLLLSFRYKFLELAVIEARRTSPSRGAHLILWLS